MHINRERIDSKFKKKGTSILNQQREFDCMIRDKNKGALDRFKEEPFQLRYMRMYEADRTEQQSKKNIDEK